MDRTQAPDDPQDPKPKRRLPIQVNLSRSINLRAGYQRTIDRKTAFLHHVAQGHTITSSLKALGVARSSYQSWRRDLDFLRELEISREMAAEALGNRLLVPDKQLSAAEFSARYFGMPYADFQRKIVIEIEKMPLGNILLVQLPPEHGKTSLFEAYANMKLAYDPNMRFLVASESTDISSKIIGRVKKRMEAFGPSPMYVQHYGPFAPQPGEGRKPTQAWAEQRFSVYGKAEHDERNFSMEAVSPTTSIVSARCDHLHLDDIQSKKTGSLAATKKIMEWFRQDALTRPGEKGITTIFGTKVSDEDFYEELEDDEDLVGILSVIRMPALVTDPDNPAELKPLWHERYTMAEMDRMRRKVGSAVWERSYMMHRSAGHGTFTFTRDDVEACIDPEQSMAHPVAKGTQCLIGLDPALGGRSAVVLFEQIPNKLRLRKVWELSNLQSNRQVVNQVRLAVEYAHHTGGQVTDLVIEVNNWQKGLLTEESLADLKLQYGFTIRPHKTGLNKHIDDSGVASMATSFARQEIVIPGAMDEYTEFWRKEFISQLLSWRPDKRGNKLRQDLVMASWFVWLLWRQREKRIDEFAKTDAWKRAGVPWKPTNSGLLVPVGAR